MCSSLAQVLTRRRHECSGRPTIHLTFQPKEIALAKNTGERYRKEQMTDRHQQYYERTDRYDKYDGAGNYLGSKASGGKFKGVETREAKNPPRS